MQRSDFHYDLPPELIAQTPLAERRASRLLVLDGTTGALDDRRFAELPELLASGDLLVFNDTRVLPARVIGRKTTGGRVELLLERLSGPRSALVHLRASHKPKPGADVELPGDTVQRTAEVSDAVFSTYLVPFEVVSVLLLAALIGAIVIARKD